MSECDFKDWTLSVQYAASIYEVHDLKLQLNIYFFKQRFVLTFDMVCVFD